MQSGDWFRSPTPPSKNQDEFLHYGNICDPSPVSLLIKPCHEPIQITFNLFQPIDCPVKVEEELINSYLIVFQKDKNEQEEVTPLKIKVEEASDLTLSPEMQFRSRSKKYRIRSTKQKELIVQEAAVMGLNRTSKKYKVSVNNICRWRKRCERKEGAGRKISDPEMEKKLVEWILNRQEPVNKRNVRNTAKELCINEDFKGSKGWFERLMIRHPYLKDFVQI